jgi:hypothetical protein
MIRYCSSWCWLLAVVVSAITLFVTRFQAVIPLSPFCARDAAGGGGGFGGGRRYVVPACRLRQPYMVFLFVGSSALTSGFLPTEPRDSAVASV